MRGIHVTSEIKPLKKVLLHRPGRELLNLTPNTLEELLFDDIPYLKVAEEEHDAFSQVLRDNGVEVVYLEDLMAQVLDISSEIREQFLRQFIEEAGISATKYHDIIYNYLNGIKSSKELVLKTMEGIYLQDLPRDPREVENSLVDQVRGDSRFVVKPMPNLYFTRDPFASVGTGVLLNRMRYPTRRRETIYADYIFRYHPDFAGVRRYYDRTDHASIEGGDVLNLTADTIAVGISQRTSPDGIESAARRLFSDPEASVRTVLAFDIPSSRAFMHLDTVFTQIDTAKYIVHPAIIGPLTVYEITPGDGGAEDLHIERVDAKLETILEKYTHAEHVQLIHCGGDDMIAAAREQWNDGSNTLCVAPGKVIVYERNDVTNPILRQCGVEILEMPSAELSRGRGGPRCMSMPLIRAD